MKKLLFCIFAHPDDEAFGPAGTLLKLRAEGYDIHLILLTDGEAGVNIDNVPDLAAIRLDEWYASASLLSASSAHALHYPDGTLETIDTGELEEKLRQHIRKIINDYVESTEVSFMTFEPNGLTGHRDHIVASEVTTRITKDFQPYKIWYFCLDSTQAPLDETTYYKPRSREDSYITKKIDITPWLETKYLMMDAHHSQRNDAEVMKKLGATTECFHIDTF
jgi:LmbE family N-acetylglucosaminyl deacetylase